MTEDDRPDDLDADLRALFADERLGLPVERNAVGSVVAGARRRRRRRTAVLATGGALGVAAIVLAGGLAAGHVIRPDTVRTGGPGGDLTTTSYARTPAPVSGQGSAPAPSGPEVEPSVLGPDGFGALKLGMSLSEAERTGMINASVSEPVPGCAEYTYQGQAQQRGKPGAIASPYYVYFGSAGLEAIAAPSGVLTSEGIGTGSTGAELTATYPRLSRAGAGVYSTPVPNEANAFYRFDLDATGTVSRIYLTTAQATCLR